MPEQIGPELADAAKPQIAPLWPAKLREIAHMAGSAWMAQAADELALLRRQKQDAESACEVAQRMGMGSASVYEQGGMRAAQAIRKALCQP